METTTTEELISSGVLMSYLGEQTQPNDGCNIHAASSLGQFILHTNRSYSRSALRAAEQNEGLNLIFKEGANKNALPYFYIKLMIQPDDLHHFIHHEGAAFYQFLTTITSQSSGTLVQGNRPSFVGEFFTLQHEELGEVLATHIFVGTTVFQSDYLVTLDFPSTFNQYQLVAGNLYQQIVDTYPNLSVQLDFKVIE